MSSSSNPPPHLIVSSDDHRANIWIVTLLCLSISTVAVVARWLAKATYRLKLKEDDYGVVVAYILATIQYGLLIAATAKGLGFSLSKVNTSNLTDMAQYYYTSQIFWILAIYCAKVCMLLLLRGIFEFQGRLNYALASFLIAALTSVLTISVKCSPKVNLLDKSDDQCSSRLARWITVTVLDIISEIIIFFLLVSRLQTVQMSLKDKSKIGLAFLTRLSIIAFSILFIVSYSHIFGSDDAGQEISFATIYQQCSLATSLTIVAILPCFRVIFQSSDVTEQPIPTTVLRSRNQPVQSGVNGSSGSCRGNDADRSEKLRRMSSSTFVESSRSA